MEPFIIDCDDCIHQHTETCGDCVVTFICSSESVHAAPTGEAVVIDASERLALRRMSAAGLLPDLHHVPRSG